MTLPRVTVQFDPPNAPLVTIDRCGDVVTLKPDAVRVTGRTGELPSVLLEVHAEAVDVLEAGVDVQAIAADPGDDVAGFLRGVDPETLGREALANAGMGDGSPATLILRQLRRYAGDTDA